MSEIKKIHMGPAKCAVDLGDGSERGEYVNQDYILNKLGRPHRAVSLIAIIRLTKHGLQERETLSRTRRSHSSGIIPMMTILHIRAVSAEQPTTSLSPVCVM